MAVFRFLMGGGAFFFDFLGCRRCRYTIEKEPRQKGRHQRVVHRYCSVEKKEGSCSASLLREATPSCRPSEPSFQQLQTHSRLLLVSAIVMGSPLPALLGVDIVQDRLRDRSVVFGDFDVYGFHGDVL
jgi:hypothetical protein